MLRANLGKPLARWEAYAFAVVFIVVVWQFGNYLDHRRAVSDAKSEIQISQAAHVAHQLRAANDKLQATARKQTRLNAENRHLRIAVCTIFDGIPAPEAGTEFSAVWRHARHEAQCGKSANRPKPNATESPPAPASTVTVTPSPPAPKPRPSKHPSKHHHHAAHPNPTPSCLLPTGKLVKCVTTPPLNVQLPVVHTSS